MNFKYYLLAATALFLLFTPSAFAQSAPAAVAGQPCSIVGMTVMDVAQRNILACLNGQGGSFWTESASTDMVAATNNLVTATEALAQAQTIAKSAGLYQTMCFITSEGINCHVVNTSTGKACDYPLTSSYFTAPSMGGIEGKNYNTGCTP